jgi:GNAT superfamily N-acetyltransferase
MESIHIRPANCQDLEALLRFEQGVITAERPFDTTLKTGAIHYYDLQVMIESPEVQLVVAGIGEVLVGCGYARLETAKRYLKHAVHAYLGFMYVDPSHRGKGINALIIEQLRQWSIWKGVSELRLDVYYGNLPAIRAYEKAGFKRHMVEMRAEARSDLLLYPLEDIKQLK